MPRIARAVAVGIPHHITQRGNYRQAIFGRDDDYRQYLEWLKYYSDKYLLKIWAYCLMNNHVHFVAVPETEESMARTFNTLHIKREDISNQIHLFQKAMRVQGHDKKCLKGSYRVPGK